MSLEEYLKVIEKFLVDYKDSAHANGYVLGVSGGVDSSMVALLTKKAVGKDHLTCFMIPIHSLKEDLEDALELCKENDLNYIVFDASEVFDQYVKVFSSLGIELTTAVKSNLKAR